MSERKRGKNFKEVDRDAIRLLLSQGYSVRKIAHLLNRGKSGIQGQIDRMRKDGSISQGVMDLGQADEQQ